MNPGKWTGGSTGAVNAGRLLLQQARTAIKPSRLPVGVAVDESMPDISVPGSAYP